MRLRQFYCRRSAVEQTAPRPNILESNRLRYFSVSTGIQAGEAAHKLKSNMKLPRLSTSTDPRGFHGSISTGSERALIRHALFSGHARSHNNPGKASLRILSEHDIGPGIDRTFTRFLALAHKFKEIADYSIGPQAG